MCKSLNVAVNKCINQCFVHLLLGKISVPCNINGLVICHTVIVVDHIFPNLIVGTDFLSQNKAVINYRDNTLDILDGLVSLPLQKFVH